MRPRLREDAHLIITDFIAQKLEEAGADGVVIGLSGGIDSAVVSKLCCDAIGEEKVLNISMPTKSFPPVDREESEQFCAHCGMELRTIPIDDMVSAFLKHLPSPERRDLMGNVMARCRMVILFHHANLMNRLVMGTSNKSELLIGYFTKCGDGGSDFAPIGDLYKTEVRQLAKKIGVPECFIEKVPTAGLWENQTDEGEMGVSYDDLDRILLGIEIGLSPEEISSRAGLDIEMVNKVIRMHRRSVHKRKMPLIPKIGIRTIGLDWRE